MFPIFTSFSIKGMVFRKNARKKCFDLIQTKNTEKIRYMKVNPLWPSFLNIGRLTKIFVSI